MAFNNGMGAVVFSCGKKYYLLNNNNNNSIFKEAPKNIVH